jgi:hypothetical protein
VEEFSMADHLAVIQDIKTYLCHCNLEKYESGLASIANNLSYDNPRTILRDKEPGQWLL